MSTSNAETNFSNFTTVSTFQSIFKSIIQILLSPIYLIFPLVHGFFLFNKYLLNHFIFIPLKLLFLITIYIPFIKIPIVIPIKFLLELNDDWNEKTLSWFQSQIELLLINIIHFFMVNVFLGIFVGILTGLNLKFIRYLLTWNETKSTNNKPLVKKASKGSPKKLKAIKSKPTSFKKFPLNFDQVIIPDSVEEALGISQLPSTNKTISTGINPNVTHNIRTFKKSSGSSDEDILIYEDDDGYSYAQDEVKSDSVNQSTLSPKNQLSNISEEEEPSSNDSSQFSTLPNDTFKTSFVSIKEEVEIERS